MAQQGEEGPEPSPPSQEFACVYSCGVTGDYAAVALHERTCALRPAPAQPSHSCSLDEALTFLGCPRLGERLAPAAARIWQARRGSSASDIAAEEAGVQELMRVLLDFHGLS